MLAIFLAIMFQTYIFFARNVQHGPRQSVYIIFTTVWFRNIEASKKKSWYQSFKLRPLLNISHKKGRMKSLSKLQQMSLRFFFQANTRITKNHMLQWNFIGGRKKFMKFLSDKAFHFITMEEQFSVSSWDVN